MPNTTRRDDMYDFPSEWTVPGRGAELSRSKTGFAMRGGDRYLTVDPEEHLERITNAPGAEGPTYRVGQDHLPYGGSTDAREEGSTVHRSTKRVMDQKLAEASEPAGSPNHGAGLLDALMGEEIEAPVHVIADPRPPVYGHGSDEDAGGFGHHEWVQWHGHHRVAAAAEKQRLQREEGMENWQVEMPVEHHFGSRAAIRADSAIRSHERTVANSMYSQRQQAPRRRNAFLSGILHGGGLLSTDDDDDA